MRYFNFMSHNNFISIPQFSKVYKAIDAQNTFLFFKKGVRGIELKKKLANKFYIWQKLPNINSLKSTFWSRLKNSFAIRHTK